MRKASKHYIRICRNSIRIVIIVLLATIDRSRNLCMQNLTPGHGIEIEAKLGYQWRHQQLKMTNVLQNV